jgi:hypothetical protein
MNQSPWRLIVLLAIAGVFITLVLLRGAAPASCSDATAARHAGMFTGAQKEYASILQAEPKNVCARDGLQALVMQRCLRAGDLARGKAEEQAKKLYAAALDTEPADLDVDCAVTGLAALPAANAKSSCRCAEINDPDPDDPERQDGEVQDAERPDPEAQEPEAQEVERQDPEAQEVERQDPEVQDAEQQETELQEAERQEAEVQDARPRRAER